MSYFSDYLQSINALCLTHNVRHLYAFGSVNTEDFNAASDIDLMVDFLPVELERYADNYFSLKFALEKILKRKVDLLEQQAIKNPFFLDSVNAKKRVLYGG